MSDYLLISRYHYDKSKEPLSFLKLRGWGHLFLLSQWSHLLISFSPWSTRVQGIWHFLFPLFSDYNYEVKPICQDFSSEKVYTSIQKQKWRQRREPFLIEWKEKMILPWFGWKTRQWWSAEYNLRVSKHLGENEKLKRLLNLKSHLTYKGEE